MADARIEAMNDDFESLAGERPAGFMCPLCAREVDRGCVSLAHAPSKRLGGRSVTLTCRRCNSRMGTWYEAHTIAVVRTRQASKSGTWTERLRAGSDDPGQNLVDVNIAYELDGSGNIASVSIRPAKSGSAAAKYWNDQVKRIVSKPNGTVRIEQKLAPPQAVARSFVYWAFLNLTAAAGYAFAGAPGSRVVADALLDQDSTVLGTTYRLQVPPIGTVLREIEPSEPFIWLGPGGVIDIDALGWRFGDFLAILPWPTDEAGEIYRKLDARAVAGAGSFGSGKVLTPDLLKAVYAPKPARGPTSA